MDEQARQDLFRYRRLTLVSAFTTHLVLLGLILFAHMAKIEQFESFLIGSLMGVFFASLNVFALGYAFYQVAVKKAARIYLLLPALTFLSMCFLTYLMAVYFLDGALGFALGLTVPVLFTAIIIVATSKPA